MIYSYFHTNSKNININRRCIVIILWVLLFKFNPFVCFFFKLNLPQVFPWGSIIKQNKMSLPGTKRLNSPFTCIKILKITRNKFSLVNYWREGDSPIGSAERSGPDGASMQDSLVFMVPGDAALSSRESD